MPLFSRASRVSWLSSPGSSSGPSSGSPDPSGASTSNNRDSTFVSPATPANAPPPAYNDQAGSRSVPDDFPTEPQPPGKDEVDAVNVSAAFDKLTLTDEPHKPDVDTCLAHLKLLFAIQTMKEEIGYSDGIFNIWDSRAEHPEYLELGELPQPPEAPKQKSPTGLEDSKLEALSKLREKRWALFVARAVDRYESWWASLPRDEELTEDDMELSQCSKYSRFPDMPTARMIWHEYMLPPLGK